VIQLSSVVDRIRTFEPTLRGYGIDRLYIFGSYAREEAAALSDFDLLVHFRPGHRGGYFDMARVKRALEDDLGKRSPSKYGSCLLESTTRMTPSRSCRISQIGLR